MFKHLVADQNSRPERAIQHSTAPLLKQGEVQEVSSQNSTPSSYTSMEMPEVA